MVKRSLAKEFGTVPKSITEMYGDATRHDECIAACNNVLKNEPKNGPALVYMGFIHHKRKEYAAANKYLKKATKLYPWFYLAWQRRGDCHLALREFKKASDAYMECHKRNPRNEGNVSSLAVSFYMQGRKDLAVMILEESLKLFEKRGLIHFTLGMLLERMGDKESAFDAYMHSQVESETEEDKAQAALRMGMLLRTNE